MTTERKLYIAGFILLALVAGVLIKGWLLEREARIHAEATQSADEKIIAASQDAIKARDASTAQVTAALAAQAAAIKTPQQAAQVIHDYLPAPTPAPGQPATPAPPIPVVERADLSAKIQSELPAAPSYGILTDQQLIDQSQKDVECKAVAAGLTTCQQDKLDLQKQLAAKTNEANTWEAAAKGGTKLQRLGRVAKISACAGAGAAVGAKADQASPARGAASGGVLSAILCSIF